MSQEKVDRYKEQKRNRKAIQAEEKERGISHKALCRTGCHCIGCVAWIFCHV